MSVRGLHHEGPRPAQPPPVRRDFQGTEPLAAGVSISRSVLIAAVTSGLTAAGVSAAEVSLGPVDGAEIIS